MVWLDGALKRHRRVVVAAWAVAFLVSLPLAVRQSDHLIGGGFEDPSSQSSSVQRELGSDYSGVARAVLVTVLVPRDDARPNDMVAAIHSVEREISQTSDVQLVPAQRRVALENARAQPDRPVALFLNVAGHDDRSIDVAHDLRAELGIRVADAGRAAGGRVEVHLVGQGAVWAAFQDVAKADVAEAEARAFPAIALVLLAAFGSLAAAALPLGLGVATVTITGALIYLLSLAMDMSIFVTNVSSMLGIGVAVDYSLFVVARYREEVRRGRPPDEARATALSTSGVAVIFSGLTVIASLTSLFLIDSTALHSIAIGAIVVVALSLLGAATLLPVLITLLGRRAHERGRLGAALERRRSRRASDGRVWERWTALVMRRPVLSLLAAVAVLLALAAPALDLNMANSDLRQLDSETGIAEGVRTAGSLSDVGLLAPARVVVHFEAGNAGAAANRRTLAAVRRAIESEPLVGGVVAPRLAADGRSALVTAIFQTDPESQAARDAVDRMRARLPAAAGPGARVEVGGTTAAIMDFDRLVSGSMGRIILFVLALSFPVLVLLLRSIVLPLKAVLMNVLSVAAGYGVLVAVFQWGWLEFAGLQPAPYIDTITPPLVLALVFGLSMDYEVFMLTRIRERYALTGNIRSAVAGGLATSARTITSAALIMVVVLIAFASAGLPAVQRLGIAAAAAIAVDATIVRLVLVPAAMVLLGRWNWWLPAPLARILPSDETEAVRPSSRASSRFA